MKRVILLLLLAVLLLSGCQPYTPATVGKTQPSTAPSSGIPEVTTVPGTQEPTMPTAQTPTTLPATQPTQSVPPTQPTQTVPVTTQPHIHSYFGEVIAPSCTEGGYTLHLCACGDQFVDTETDPLGHDWGSWITVEPATAEKEGLQQRACSRCTAQDQQKIEKLPPSHSHAYATEVVAPTCTQRGYTLHTCSCGDRYQDRFTDALGHSFTKYRTNGDATCTADGTKTAKCDRCSANSTLADAGSALGHNYSDYHSNGDATCTADGTKTASCDRCGANSTVADTGSALGHDWGQWSVSMEPTVEKDGIESRTCGRCAATDSKKIDRLPAPHEHDYKKEKVAATCTEGGYNLYTCECGDSYREETTQPTGHSWGDWTVTVEPTVSSSGTRTRSCEACDAEETASVEMLPVEGGFVFVSWTETVSRNEDAYVTIWGTPGVEYDIAVFYKSGESEAKGLENKVADEHGYVTWTWHVGGRTAPGTFKITVTDGVHKRTIYFTVLEAVNET